VPLVSSQTVTEVIRASLCNRDTNHLDDCRSVSISVVMLVSVPAEYRFRGGVIASLSMARGHLEWKDTLTCHCDERAWFASEEAIPSFGTGGCLPGMLPEGDLRSAGRRAPSLMT
jgi:hypothetical protein